jgi:hypothetical protein
MFWTMKGHRGDKAVEVTWRDGVLSGDPDTVDDMKILALHYEGKVISSLVDSTTHDHLQNPMTAATLMHMVCTDQPVTVDTDVPPLPELPEGATG